MKILYPNPAMPNIMRDGRDKTKEQCSCIAIVAPSKMNGLVK